MLFASVVLTAMVGTQAFALQQVVFPRRLNMRQPKRKLIRSLDYWLQIVLQIRCASIPSGCVKMPTISAL